jgi:hypothetical protein
MKKYFIFLFTLFCILNLNAEGHRSNRRSNPNYKNLKVYVKVLERYGKSDCYLAQIDIVNTGNSSVSFRETTYGYSWIFGFSAGGVMFITEDERLYYEKKRTDIPTVKGVEKKVRILAHSTYTIKTKFYIRNRELFLKTNKNLRLEFHFNDANLGFMEDESRPKIISENIIEYKW